MRKIIKLIHNVGTDVRVTLIDEVVEGETPMPAEQRIFSGADYAAALNADGDTSVAKIKALLDAEAARAAASA